MHYPVTQLRRSVSWVLASLPLVSAMLVIHSRQIVVPSYIFISTADTVCILFPLGLVLISPYFVRLSIITTFIALPQDLAYKPSDWNSMTHGNITVVIVLLFFRCLSIPVLSTILIFIYTLYRVAWFMGIGRTRYYYGKPSPSVVNKSS